jgi:RsiW-degrading membrane proteinase PrsW (M82 family)
LNEQDHNRMPTQPVCCICGTPLEEPYKVLGNRAYCDYHYATINKSNTGFWRSAIIQLVLVGVVSAAIALLANLLPPLSGTPLLLLGLVIALIPTILWLGFFYQQDRLEPEPKAKIAQVFLLAFVLADFLGMRVIYDWFRLPDWAVFDTFTSLLTSILVIGFIYQAITYMAVRMVVYNTDEFDERMDGIVYGTIAGLGIATLLNIRYIFDNGGVALGPGVIRVTTTTLALASFSGLFGYFLAEAKFEHKPVWWIPLGFATASILHGLFSWLINEVSASGLTVNPWRSLILGLIVTLAVFALLLVVMRRSTEATLRQAPPSQP